jgi:hypothetical protein
MVSTMESHRRRLLLVIYGYRRTVTPGVWQEFLASCRTIAFGWFDIRSTCGRASDAFSFLTATTPPPHLPGAPRPAPAPDPQHPPATPTTPATYPPRQPHHPAPPSPQERHRPPTRPAAAHRRHLPRATRTPQTPALTPPTPPQRSAPTMSLDRCRLGVPRRPLTPRLRRRHTPPTTPTPPTPAPTPPHTTAPPQSIVDAAQTAWAAPRRTSPNAAAQRRLLGPIREQLGHVPLSLGP